jgi:hypothetical protein
MDRESAAQHVRAGMSGLTVAMSSMRSFTINGKTWTAPEIVELLVVDPGNIDVHIAHLPAWVAWWGVTSSDAKHALDAHEAAYRVARDKWATKRRTDGKATKDQLDEEWRCTPEYPTWYGQKAELERAWSCAQFVYEAFNRKSTMLSALARMYADEKIAGGAGRGDYGPGRR